VKTFGVSERRACGPRFGYRRLGVLLAREGQRVNHKRLFRVYREAGLSVKRTRRKKLVRTGLSQPVLTAPMMSGRWTFCAMLSRTVASFVC
jgi:transposase InsO family protein